MPTKRYEEYNKAIEEITETILEDYEQDRSIDKMDVFRRPDRDAIVDIIKKLLNVLYPGYYRERYYKSYNPHNRLSILIEDVTNNLRKQIAFALRYRDDFREAGEREVQEEAERMAIEFFRRIPKVREYLDTDIQATFDGDPAACDTDEIIMSYPGLFATAINRMAHELYLMQVPLIPRIMTEYGHGHTGIDIHPGATIGKYLMIDHGTGVVVGETSIIGEHVKIYQGVTIGALSTRGGQRLKGAKRHPTIEDNVTIYSGASILGGETTIGEGAVIGSNCFITSSVAAGTRVTIKGQELQFKNGDEATIDVDI